MDIFKQKRYMVLIIIVLIIFNLSTLTMLWVGRPPQSIGDQVPINPRKKQAQLEKLLKTELMFNDSQIAGFLDLRDKHNRQINKLSMDIRELKREMFDKVLLAEPQPMISDSLLKLTMDKQAELERITFEHFLNIKNLCSSEQQKKLRILMHEVLGPPPGENMTGPPPGENMTGPRQKPLREKPRPF
ncbi:MAG: hypothetical protein CVV23_05520 [Ignavibacteriae bacterium HGW-Ignavibacteriae-2]|nr:MAG: hypothetical protein CVV23_05520 [Ignavibacteriae bacterium HGW-Ignavibacteriae-2]